MGGVPQLPLHSHPGIEDFSQHPNGQCLLNEGAWYTQHTLVDLSVLRSWPNLFSFELVFHTASYYLGG